MNLNAPYLHLLVNHWPIFAIPFCLAFFVYARMKQGVPAQKFAAIMLCVAALGVVPAFYSGGEAEDFFKKAPIHGQTWEQMHDIVEEHEEAADYALYSTLLAAFLSLVFVFKPNRATEVAVILV